MHCKKRPLGSHTFKTYPPTLKNSEHLEHVDNQALTTHKIRTRQNKTQNKSEHGTYQFRNHPMIDQVSTKILLANITSNSLAISLEII